MPQTETQATASGGQPLPYETALLEVVKGLHRDPILLFGIGAGILLVAVLAVTSSPVAALVVAVFFGVVIAARAHQRAQRIREGDDIRVGLIGSSVIDSDVATAEGGGAKRIRARIGFSKVSGSRIGTSGSARPPKTPEG